MRWISSSRERLASGMTSASLAIAGSSNSAQLMRELPSASTAARFGSPLVIPLHRIALKPGLLVRELPRGGLDRRQTNGKTPSVRKVLPCTDRPRNPFRMRSGFWNSRLDEATAAKTRLLLVPLRMQGIADPLFPVRNRSPTPAPQGLPVLRQVPLPLV